jgi:hypothetical protein
MKDEMENKKEVKEIEIIPDLNLWILKSDAYKIINDYILNAEAYKFDKNTLLILRQIKSRISKGEIRKYD